jgi:hypothetical protein
MVRSGEDLSPPIASRWLLWIVPATAIEHFGCKCMLSVSEAGDFFIRELPAHFGKAVCCALDGKPKAVVHFFLFGRDGKLLL